MVGPYAVGIVDDYYYTSIASDRQMYGVELHANIVQNLLNENFKTEIGLWNMLTILILGLSIWLVFKKFSPLNSLFIAIVLSSVYIIVSKFSYKFGYIIQISYILFLIIIMYIGSIADKYIREYKEKLRINELFGKYLHPDIVDEIIDKNKGLELGGVKRDISILFVDIRGFTSLSEKLTPEDTVGILNKYLDLTTKSIFKFHGTLDKFIGDSTMAIYNAPLDLEEHAFNAIKTAIEMKNGAEKLSYDVKERFGYDIQFGIGINSGQAVVGNIGSSLRMEYTAIGDAVNIASMLEGLAKPSQILISENTYEKVGDKIIAEFIGEIKLKGKQIGINVYEVKGVKRFG